MCIVVVRREQWWYTNMRKKKTKSKTITNQRRALYNNKGANSPKLYSDLSTDATKNRATKYEENINRVDGENRQVYKTSRKLQYLIYCNKYIEQPNIKQTDNKELKNTLDQVGLRDIYRSLCPPTAEYTLYMRILKFTWNIFKDTSYIRL